MKAILKNYRQSPRKVRLVADLVKGKPVARALNELDNLPKRATTVMKKLINAATANAKENFSVDQDSLIIDNITVNQGVTLKRYRARARGSASPINKRTSNIVLTLKDVVGKPVKATPSKEKAPEKAKAPAKATPAKKEVKKVAPKAVKPKTPKAKGPAPVVVKVKSEDTSNK